MFDFLDDIVGMFDGAGDAISGFFDSAVDIGKGALSIFDSGDDVWGALTKIGGDLLLEGANFYATTQAAEAAEAEGKSAAEVYYGNAKMYEDEALLIEGRTKDAETNARLAGLRLLSKQVVTYSKAGVTMEGSPLIVAHQTSDLIESAIQSKLDEGASAAERQRKLGENEERKAQNAIDAANFQAQATLIGSAVNSIQRWTK